MPNGRPKDRLLLRSGIAVLASGAAIAFLGFATTVLAFIAPWRGCQESPDQPTECGWHPHDADIAMGGLIGIPVGFVVMAIGFGVLLPALVRATDPRRRATPATSA